MNRETEQHFSEVPYIDKPRSKFKRAFDHKTTWNTGDLIPVYLDQDILPGDTVKIDMSMVVRMATPLYPVMDNAYLDFYFFFVPNRLLWDHWKAFWGENTNAWYQQVEYEIPQIATVEGNTFTSKTLADYMGLPIDVPGLSVSALPFRAYTKIVNDWFKDENLEQDLPNTTGDNTVYPDIRYTYTAGYPFIVNRFHDYFTSCLPAPQKGNDVYLPLGQYAPVYTRSEEVPNLTTTQTALQWYAGGVGTGGKTTNLLMTETSGKLNTTYDINNTETTPVGVNELSPANLWTDLSLATASTITQLRQAFAIQRFYEAQARGGWEKSA